MQELMGCIGRKMPKWNKIFISVFLFISNHQKIRIIVFSVSTEGAGPPCFYRMLLQSATSPLDGLNPTHWSFNTVSSPGGATALSLHKTTHTFLSIDNYALSPSTHPQPWSYFQLRPLLPTPRQSNHQNCLFPKNTTHIHPSLSPSLEYIQNSAARLLTRCPSPPSSRTGSHSKSPSSLTVFRNQAPSYLPDLLLCPPPLRTRHRTWGDFSSAAPLPLDLSTFKSPIKTHRFRTLMLRSF